MFEVVVENINGTTEIWDGLELMPAHCIYFCAMLSRSTARVELNEFTV